MRLLARVETCAAQAIHPLLAHFVEKLLLDRLAFR
jgi:hypothetical protein